MAVDDETKQIEMKIIDWLIEENYDPIPKKDPTGTNDIYMICVPPGTIRLNLFIGKPTNGKRIVVGIAFSMPHGDRKLYTDLSNEIKKNFRLNLMRDLTLLEIMVGCEPADISTNFNSIRMMDAIYYDGLTKDRLFRAVNNVLRAYSLLMLDFETHIPNFHPTNSSDLA